MERLTGDAFFPGGMGEFHAPKNQFLVFEEGPSVDIILQWATYRDASDQTSLSRIWGGIHPPVDDIPGRIIGQVLGPQSYKLAKDYWSGWITCPTDLVPDRITGFDDLITVLTSWGECDALDLCDADLDDDGLVGFSDMIILLTSWGECPE